MQGSPSDPSGILLPGPTLVPGGPPLPQEQLLGALLAFPSPAQLRDEWALHMIDLFDSMKRW